MEDKPKTEEKAITTQGQAELVPTFGISLDEAKKRFSELQEFIKSQMVEGEDYGTVKGISKPFLFKSGAEKLAILYGFAVRFDIVDQIKDFDKGMFHYQLKCQLVSKRTGFVIAEGVGSCNSKERKYLNQDVYTLDNTILKMAKKRALVDAVLTATRTSGLFSQDEEVVDSEVITTPVHEAKTGAKTDVKTEVKTTIDPSLLLCSSCNEAITEKVYIYSVQNFSKPLCFNCQPRKTKK